MIPNCDAFRDEGLNDRKRKDQYQCESGMHCLISFSLVQDGTRTAADICFLSPDDFCPYLKSNSQQ